jgi:hypothetical protein
MFPYFSVHSPSLYCTSHTVTFSLYCIRSLSLSCFVCWLTYHYSFTWCLSVALSQLSHWYIYLLLSRLTDAKSHWLLAICSQTRLLFFSGCCRSLCCLLRCRHQIAHVYCQVVQPLCLGYCTQATISRKQIDDPGALAVSTL